MRKLIFPLSVATITLAFCASARAADGPVDFNRDIRPILSDNCYHCHGNDKNHIKGKLRLDDRDWAIRKEAIVPGKPEASEAMARILSNDPDELMPPPETHKKLSAAQKDLIKRWIAEGAEYKPHWAYIPPVRTELPAVQDGKWVRNPIDNYVLSKLESKKLTPSPEADKRTLLRRLSLDLVGLPPTPVEVEAFVNDSRPDAYERQVERLLASPHFGERMAVPWLDAVRFSDTVGFHGDQNQNVFPFRDYVINAFNSNKPFDQFTIEQIAGDLLPNPTTEQLVASGFNRLNMMTREGGAQAKEYIAKYQADRAKTVGLTWLGSTFGCAECHDHKFDPISTKDFYSLTAYFGDIRQWGVYSDYTYTPNRDLKGFTNDHPFPPEIQVEVPYLKARLARLERQLRDESAVITNRLNSDAKAKAGYEAWIQATQAFLKENPTGWAVPPLAKAGPSPKIKAEDVKAAGRQAENRQDVGNPATLPVEKPAASAPPTGFLTIKPPAKGKANDLSFRPAAGWIASIKLEAAGELSVGTLNNGSQRQGLRISAAVKPVKGAVRKAAVYHADADFKEPRYASTAELIGVKDGWKLSASHMKQTQTSVWLLDPPLKLADGETLEVSIAGDTTVPVRVSISPFASWNPLSATSTANLEAVATSGANPSNEQKAILSGLYLYGTAWDADGFARYKKLQRDILECRDGKAWMQVTVAQKPIVTRVLPRGNWQDESGEIVQPETPHFLPKLPGIEGKAQTRLDLAKWIVSEQSPLTGRTVTNRFWKMFFGTGLCASIEDLGLQGESPSHPELLDWLAVEFRDPKLNGAKPWDVKHLVRLIVNSSTYRQKSELRPSLRDVDPANRLLSAQSPVRLEAEFVRDNALFAAGLLNLADLGGPSVKPYQPEGYYAAIQFPSRVYNPDPDERQYRRGVYMHWQRTFLHPMLANFDAPSREDSICVRVVSNTPQQALTLLNDPQFVEASRVLAQNLIAEGGSDAEKIDRLYARSLARPAKEKEKASLLKFLAGQREIYKATPEDAAKLTQVGNTPASGADLAELSAWANTCRVVLNLQETITRY